MTSYRFSLLLVAALAACSGSKETDNPRIELSDVGFALHLPQAMQSAIDSLAPGFRSVRASSFRSDVSQAAAESGGSSPAAVAAVGDFDHDGSIDAVVEGTTPGDTALRVIAILNGKKPSAMDVTRFPVYDADAVGIYLTNPPAGTAGAFEVVAYPDSTLLFQFEDGTFKGERLGNQ
jgi:hypothetical protein